MDGSTAQSLYREEKARALQERRISHAQLMTEAKEAFAKMLADAQLARKGGRPKSNPNAPGAARPAVAAAVKAPAAPVVAKKVAPKAEVAAAPAPKAPAAAKVVAKVVKKAAPVKKAVSSKVRVAAKRAQPMKVAAKKGAK